MTKRAKVFKVADLIKEINERLQKLKINLSKLTLREKVLRLAEFHYKSRCLGVSVVVGDGLSSKVALERIKVYFERHVGVIIDGVELDVVSGIAEYARRIRQLRTEQGYRILTGASRDEDSQVSLKIDQYMLVSKELDQEASKRWLMANRIRKQKIGSKQKLFLFLKENLGKIVSTEELAYVSKDKSNFGRRIRELRTEDGYAIATKTTGRPDLRIGEYILLSLERVAEEHDRHISAEVQREVYERDKSTCRNPKCLWNVSMWNPNDARILELHHIQQHAHGGLNTAENLIILCNKCHDEVHARRLSLDFTNK